MKHRMRPVFKDASGTLEAFKHASVATIVEVNRCGSGGCLRGAEATWVTCLRQPHILSGRG